MNRATAGEIEPRDRWLVLLDRELAVLHLVVDLFGYHRENFVHCEGVWLRTEKDQEG